MERPESKWAKAFREREQSALLPLPLERFPFFHEALRSVHRDGHISVDKAYYSVPPEFLGRKVWVRWDARLVRIFNAKMEQIALHARQEPGKFSTQNSHLHAGKSPAWNAEPLGGWRKSAKSARKPGIGPRPCWEREALKACGC